MTFREDIEAEWATPPGTWLRIAAQANLLKDFADRDRRNFIERTGLMPERKPMPTDQAELDRIRHIHKHLDSHAAHPVKSDGGKLYVVDLRGKRHTYSEAEIAAWPEMKAKMRDLLLERAYSDAHMAYWGKEGKQQCARGEIGLRPYVDDGINEAIARGLCLFREQLTDSAPKPEANDDGLLWMLPTTRCALPAGTRVRYSETVSALFEVGHWNGMRFEPMVLIDDAGAYSRQPDAVAFPRPYTRYAETIHTCDQCGHNLGFDAMTRIVGGISYHVCGEHNLGEAEFLAAALKLRSGKLEGASFNGIDFASGHDTVTATYRGTNLIDVAKRVYNDRYAKPQQVAVPWTIPTGAAVCAVCDSPCEVTGGDCLFSADDGKDYPLCDTCWTDNPGCEEWDAATNNRILRRVDLDDKQIAAMQSKHDARRAKVATLRRDLDRPVPHPSEARSDRTFERQNPRFR